MARTHFRYNQDTGEWEEFDPKGKPKQVDAATFIPDDCDPFQSMVDGSWWTSKSNYRRHLKANGKIEVGNDVDGFGSVNPFETKEYKEQLKEDMTRAYYETRDRMAPLSELDRERCKRIDEKNKRNSYDRRERDRSGRTRD